MLLRYCYRFIMIGLLVLLYYDCFIIIDYNIIAGCFVMLLMNYYYCFIIIALFLLCIIALV